MPSRKENAITEKHWLSNCFYDFPIVEVDFLAFRILLLAQHGGRITQIPLEHRRRFHSVSRERSKCSDVKKKKKVYCYSDGSEEIPRASAFIGRFTCMCMRNARMMLIRCSEARLSAPRARSRKRLHSFRTCGIIVDERRFLCLYTAESLARTNGGNARLFFLK